MDTAVPLDDSFARPSFDRHAERIANRHPQQGAQYPIRSQLHVFRLISTLICTCHCIGVTANPGIRYPCTGQV
jgi:hypothetical protein